MPRTGSRYAEKRDALAPAAQQLVAAFESAIPAATGRILEAVRAEIPAYGRIADPAFFDDVRSLTEANLRALVRSLRNRRAVTDEELIFVRGPTTRRAVRHLPLEDFQHAYRIGTRIAVEELLDRANDPETQAAALSFVGPMLEYVNIVSTHVAAVYVEVEGLLLAEGDRVRRGLLDDLLAGRRPASGPREDALRQAALTPGGTHVVISAIPSTEETDEHALQAMAVAIGRVGSRVTSPLAVVREEEVVAIVPVRRSRLPALTNALHGAHARFSQQGLELAIGASTIVTGFDELPAAYHEARHARELTTARNRVVCLCTLRTFDYFTLIAGATATRLIEPQVARFVQEDLADGGVLTTTLLEYVAADLNAKAAAERLYIHVNSAHYRLARIAERTGLDVRRLTDVLELLIAVKLLSEHRRIESETPPESRAGSSAHV